MVRTVGPRRGSGAACLPARVVSQAREPLERSRTDGGPNRAARPRAASGTAGKLAQSRGQRLLLDVRQQLAPVRPPRVRDQQERWMRLEIVAGLAQPTHDRAQVLLLPGQEQPAVPRIEV